MATRIFETTRMLVRKAEPDVDDVELLYELWTDPKVMGFLGYPRGMIINRQEILANIQKSGKSVFNTYLIVERKLTPDEGQPNPEEVLRIGECKLGSPDDFGISETDVKLLPRFWGQGYGTEVKRALVDYLFRHTACHYVQATPAVQNEASIRIQEAIGGKRVGEAVFEFPEMMQDFTAPIHHYIYRIDRETWEHLQKRDDSTE